MNCRWRGLCPNETGLPGIDVMDEFMSNAGNMDVLERFYERYHADADFMDADVIFVAHPAWLVQLYLPFNKSIVLMQDIHYSANVEVANMFSPQDHPRADFQSDFLRLCTHSRNTCLGSTPFIAAEVEYFTGLSIGTMRPLCTHVLADVRARYTPAVGRNRTVLLSRYAEWVLAEIESSLSSAVTIKTTEQALGKVFTPNDMWKISAMDALVFIPYTVSAFFFWEVYAMHVPIFVPSSAFALVLNASKPGGQGMFQDGMWGGHRDQAGCLPLQPGHTPAPTLPSPCDARESAGVFDTWLGRTNAYHEPFVQRFGSWHALAHALDATDYVSISNEMREHTRKLHTEVAEQWFRIFQRATTDFERVGPTVTDRVFRPAEPDMSYSEAMERYWPDVVDRG